PLINNDPFWKRRNRLTKMWRWIPDDAQSRFVSVSAAFTAIRSSVAQGIRRGSGNSVVLNSINPLGLPDPCKEGTEGEGRIFESHFRWRSSDFPAFRRLRFRSERR